MHGSHGVGLPFELRCDPRCLWCCCRPFSQHISLFNFKANCPLLLLLPRQLRGIIDTSFL
jgi:hypothetical protein